MQGMPNTTGITLAVPDVKHACLCPKKLQTPRDLTVSHKVINAGGGVILPAFSGLNS
jgi:hypothetical protein